MRKRPLLTVGSYANGVSIGQSLALVKRKKARRSGHRSVLVLTINKLRVVILSAQLFVYLICQRHKNLLPVVFVNEASINFLDVDALKLTLFFVFGYLL